MTDPLARPSPSASSDAAPADAPDAPDDVEGGAGAGTRLPALRPPSPPVSRTLLAAVAALALAAALAVWLDGRRSATGLRSEVAQRLGTIESSVQSTAAAQTREATELRDAQAKITLLETRLAEFQAQQAALEALYRDLAPSRDEIAVSEIEQVLLVASQQLQLAGNVPSALTALQLADAKLQRLDRPQFVALRRALTRDIDQLKALPFVDVTGMSLKLDQALAAIDKLPLAMDERLPVPAPEQPAADDPPWRRLLRDVWGEVRQLVRLEVADRPAAPLVPPAQAYFLRQNLRLRLLSARIALLGHDDATFKSDIAAAEEWVRQYFDLRAKPVQALQANLKQLAATPMGAAVPDLSRSLEAVRVLRLAQDRPAGRAADRPAPTR
jgi:uroporphyrin-3 C-methyltransferase